MRKSDYYTKQAKKLGYQARSVFKLEEIQKKFNLLKTRQKILDIGSSPGSWSLFVINKFNSNVLGVDLRETDISKKKPGLFSFISRFQNFHSYCPSLPDSYLSFIDLHGRNASKKIE